MAIAPKESWQGAKEEAKEAVLNSDDYTFDVAFTSMLKRTICTLWEVLDELDLVWIAVDRS